MAGQALSELRRLFKDVYRGPFIAQVNKDTYMLDMIEREDVNRLGAFSGRQLIFPIQIGRAHGRGAGAGDGGTLGRAGRVDTLDGIV